MTDRDTDRDHTPDRDRDPGDRDPGTGRATDSGPNPSREDLEARLAELETTLEELRGELRDERAGPPRPPSLSELLRFTEQYTIPSLIALLETTIKSLELLQGTLRLADPGRELSPEDDRRRRRGTGAGSERLAGVRENAEAQLASTLSDLREALSAADLPEESAPRSILQDARELTAEIEAELERSTRPEERGPPPATEPTEPGSTDPGDGDATASDADPESRHDGAVHIDVHDPASEGESRRESSETVDGDGPVAGEPERASVDVDSELESIKRELGDEGDATDEAEEAVESGGEQAAEGNEDANAEGDGDANAEGDGDANADRDGDADADGEDGASSES
ncbi:DUF7547 family protein [Haloparvum sp. PAK95]|uniref:DUF7547 family protein n=1 Tax=Haloparvum sp. PAK95 TaxID=3418962 RepID=UPI003D2F065D